MSDAKFDNQFKMPFSRRAFFFGAAVTGLSFVNELVVKPAMSILDKTSLVNLPTDMKIASAWAVPGGMELFNADSPNARPSFLQCDYDADGPCFEGVDCHGSTSPIWTWGDMTSVGFGSDMFNAAGRQVVVIGMDSYDNWFTVVWANIGSYYGRRVGVRMTVSEPVASDKYNDWGYASGYDGNVFAGYYGTRHFFVLNQTFSSWRNHWMYGLSHVKQKFEFFYADDPSRSAIYLDQAYYTCRSVQADCGGHEWASPGGNWLGHTFVPDSDGGRNSSAVWCNDLYNGCNTVATNADEISDRTAFSFDYRGSYVEFHRGDTVGLDGYSWSFDALQGFAKLHLHKSSSNPTISNASPSYSLAGAKYNVYSDAGCTRYVGMFSTNSNGDATVAAKNGTQYLPINNTYWIKEVSPSPGYLIDGQVYSVWLDGEKTVDVKEPPKVCTIVYISDGAEVYREDHPIGITVTPSQIATDKATKPNCTPGFIGWYSESSLTNKVSHLTTTPEEVKLYGRNRCTLWLKVSSQSDAQESKQPYYLRPADSVNAATRYQWPNLAPRQYWYDDRVTLPTMKLIFEPTPDPVTGVPHWMTLRQRFWSSYDNMQSPIVNSVVMTSDKTFYCWWKYAAKDGVADDRA